MSAGKLVLRMTPRKGQAEAAIQRGVASYLRGMERFTGAFTFSHPANEGKRSPITGAQLKAAGLRAGEPDIVIYASGGRTVFIELKTLAGVLSPAQRERHEELRRHGFDVHVVKAGSAHEAIAQVEKILAEIGIVWRAQNPFDKATGSA